MGYTWTKKLFAVYQKFTFNWVSYIFICLICQLCSWVYMHAQSYLTLCEPVDCSPAGSSAHEHYLDKNTGVGHHFLPQGIILAQGLNLRLLWLLHWKADSLPLHQLGSPLLRVLPDKDSAHNFSTWVSSQATKSEARRVKQGNSKMNEAQVFLSKSAVECFPSVMLSRTYWEWVSKLISLSTCTLIFMPDNLQANRNQRYWGCPNRSKSRFNTAIIIRILTVFFLVQYSLCHVDPSYLLIRSPYFPKSKSSDVCESPPDKVFGVIVLFRDMSCR